MASKDKPFEARCVVVTRAAEQSSELITRLETLGAEVLPLPLVEFALPLDRSPLDRALRQLEDFDWLLLTSQNAVRFVADRARAIGLDLAAKLGSANTRPRVAAVGSVTERAALDQGWRVDRVSSGHGGIDLARELGGEIRGRRVLLPRSDRAKGDLPRALRDAGAEPVEVVAYRTLPAAKMDPAVLGRIERGEVDVVSFASPSAFAALRAHFGDETFRRVAAEMRIAAIGPTTAAAIRRAGVEVAIEASVSSAAGLAAAIAAYFTRNPVTPGGHT
jgi:uroporphyrinogen-III synthase